ncbi:HEAT repeat domain-containing protein [Pseudomonas entomophila]|uniref:HEAT repeat domain-containing protein n=1 Tax=Pseudomonas entomophila TaxID=312306 RepID=UPI0023D7DD4F|nr:HEAT repeat domain-containing protein [Pseudomonas entomophila]MDF0729693.1 HEAT repeat domain-containing protein [Pseudomonas entomophila]
MNPSNIITKLSDIMRDDRDFMERRIAAADALGNTDTSAARDALIAVIDDPLEDLTLQAAAIRALGKSLKP